MTSNPTATLEATEVTEVTNLYTVSGSLYPTAPFDFDKSLGFLDMFTPMQREQTLESNILTKAIMIDGQTIVFRVQSAGTTDKPQLDYILYANLAISADLQHAAEDRIRFFLSTDDDLQTFYALAEQDAAFAPIMHDLYGLHQVKFLTPFENAIWSILAQRQPMRVSKQVKQRFMEQYGGSVEIDSVIYHAFPDVHSVRHLDYDAIQAVVRNERKAAYLLGVINAFATVDEDWLRHGPIDEVEQWLLSIKGIGEWSAAFILIRGLGRMEYLGAGESRLAEIVENRYGKGTTVAAIKTRYGASKGYWAYYLRTTGERDAQ